MTKWLDVCRCICNQDDAHTGCHNRLRTVHCRPTCMADSVQGCCLNSAVCHSESLHAISLLGSSLSAGYPSCPAQSRAGRICCCCKCSLQPQFPVLGVAPGAQCPATPTTFGVHHHCILTLLKLTIKLT